MREAESQSAPDLSMPDVSEQVSGLKEGSEQKSKLPKCRIRGVHCAEGCGQHVPSRVQQGLALLSCVLGCPWPSSPQLHIEPAQIRLGCSPAGQVQP